MSNELMNLGFTEDVDFAADIIKERRMAYSSLKPQTIEEKATVYNAVSNPTDRIADHINETIFVTDIYCETVECVRAESGEVNVCPRTILIDKDGKSYVAVSNGVFGAVKRLISGFGQPTWSPALPIKVKQISKGAKNILTFEINTEAIGKKK